MAGCGGHRTTETKLNSSTGKWFSNSPRSGSYLLAVTVITTLQVLIVSDVTSWVLFD